LDAIEAVEIGIGLLSALLKGEEGGIFQGEHGERSQAGIGNGNGGIASAIGKGGEAIGQGTHQGIEAEMFPEGAILGRQGMSIH